LPVRNSAALRDGNDPVKLNNQLRSFLYTHRR
jgi:hypothetical protein